MPAPFCTQALRGAPANTASKTSTAPEGLGRRNGTPMMSMMLASWAASSASLGLRLPIHENSSALGQYRHPWGCVYHYVRIKARVLLGFRAFCSKNQGARERSFKETGCGQDVSEVVCGT